ncbi:MAG: hypothetical protein KBD60_06350 [Sterolibacterium sp.]|jgi:hypothetical protein|nr:hypothetical protein [Sterolibacterium sp.]
MALFWRITFFLAVFGNLLFFAWSQGYFGHIEDGREPQRMAHQIEPDKLRVGEVPPPPSPTEIVCHVLGGSEGWPIADARQVSDKLQADGAYPIEASLQALAHASSHWVFIPPLASKALLDKKLQELKQLGIREATPLLAESSGADRNAISLGLFSTADAATAYLATLNQRGVHSAILQPRAAPADKARLVVRAPRAFWQERLAPLLAEVNLPASPVEDCPAAP